MCKDAFTKKGFSFEDNMHDVMRVSVHKVNGARTEKKIASGTSFKSISQFVSELSAIFVTILPACSGASNTD
jgi:hypothetical protein